jgi:Predicted molecular chaperone distantly related to HSP70-fold metalloproteases
LANTLYIGLMSGTSLDGVDALLVDFSSAQPRAVSSHHQPYPTEIRAALLELSHASHPELHQLAQMDVQLGELYAQAVNTLLDRAGIAAATIQAIGSHGQTVRHHPHGPHPYTLQLGDPNVIAERTGITTVADFRRRDIAAGGQGAPLVPAFHAAQFHHPGYMRVVVNLGGMANITVLPANGNAPVIGFDTGPGNVLLDGWAQRHRGSTYDADGAWAAAGTRLPALLQRLLAEPYFTQAPPKSTGRERFNLPWLETRLEGAEDPQDVQATLLELTALSVSQAINGHAGAAQEVLVCGGGAYNRALLQRLAHHLAPRTVLSTARYGVEPQAVEAMAFAWLAQQTLHGKPGNLPTVTGARRPVVLGGIYRI